MIESTSIHALVTVKDILGTPITKRFTISIPTTPLAYYTFEAVTSKFIAYAFTSTDLS